MRTIEQVRQAQEMAVTLSLHANCRGFADEWSQAEAKYRRSKNRAAAEMIAWKALTHCVGCPVMDLCETWADRDSYTGLAAGQVWVSGRPYPPDRVYCTPENLATAS